MPISRYEIRNDYSLADPDIYKAADKDDPEALLEAVAMAGLVGLLRQLGDLAEFAAEIFHDLHEEVMATATRGHGLMVRVQQLESEFPSIEKAFLSQTSHSAFFSNGGTDWHPSLHTTQNLITRGDLPRFVMDSYEECRGPPRLFLLDKFDVAGAGACLKRYTDPSFFKVEAASYGMTSAEIQREKKSRKVKKKNSRWRNGGTPKVLPPSHAKLHQLFLEEQVQNGVSNPARLVKLKRRPNWFPFDSKSGKSYMEKYISTSLPEDKLVDEISYGSLSLEFPSVVNSESGFKLLETNPVSSVKESVRRKISPYSSQSLKKNIQRPSIDGVHEDVSGRELLWVPKQYPNSDSSPISSSLHEAADEKEIAVYGEHKADEYLSDDIASDEVDNYMDALATMESEIETDSEFKTKNELGLVNNEKQETDSDANEEQLEAQFSDLQSVGNSSASEDGNSSFKKDLSSFSYSDAGSTSADNKPSDFDVSEIVLTSADIFDTEVTDTSNENDSMGEKNEGSFSASTEKAEIPSRTSEFGDSVAVHVPEDQGEILVGDTCGGADLHEISSSHDELDKEFIRTHVTHQNKMDTDVNLPCTSMHSDHPSHSSQDVPLTDTISAGNHLVDKLDDEENAICNDTIHFSNTLDVFPKEYISEILLENELQTELKEDICTQNLVSGGVSFPQSVTSNVEDESIVPAVVEFENLQPEASDSVNAAIQSAREITVDTTDASDSISFMEQHGLEQKDDVTPLKTGSAEVGICYGHEFSDVGVLNKVDGVEMGEITPGVNILGSGDAVLEISSDSWKPIGSGLHANAGEVDGESSFERKSQAEYLHNIQELVQNEFHVYNGRLLPSHNESVKQKAIFIDEIPSPSSESELLMCVTDSSLAAEAEIRLCQAEAVMASSSAGCSSQDSESIASEQSKFIENTGGALPSAYQHYYLAMTSFDQKLMTQGDQLDIGQPDVDETKYEEILVSEQVQSTDHEEISVLEEVQSMDHMDEGRSDAHSELYLGTNEPAAVQVSIQRDFLDLTSPHEDGSSLESSHLENMLITNPVDEIKSKEISQLDQTQSMDHVDKGNTEAHSEPYLVENNEALQVDLLVDLQADCLDTKSLHGDETSLQSFSQLDETQSKGISVSEQVQSMDQMDEGSTYAHSEPCLVANKPTVQVDMEADCHDMNPSHGYKVSFESTQFEQVQFTDHTDHERLANAFSKSFTLHSPIEDSQLEISEAGCHKIDIFDEAVYAPTSVRPSSSVLSEVQINSESVPPPPSLLPAEQMQFANHSDHERVITAAKSLSLHLQKEDSESEFAQPGNYKVGTSEQAWDPPSSVLPSFSLLPEVPQINLEEMPPLPPLPPVQWRIGRPQPTSLTSDTQNTFGLFPPIFSAKTNTEMGYPALNMDGSPLPVPILASSDVKDEDCQHVHEHLASSMVHSSPLSMQMPTTSSDRNRQDDFHTSGCTPNMIPFLTLPSTSNDSPQHEYHTREVGILQPSSSSFLSVSTTGDKANTFSSTSPHEDSSHSLQHLPQETSLDNEKFRGTTISSEAMMVNPDANLAAPALLHEQPKYVSKSSEEEPIRTSTSLLPTLEDGIPDWKWPMKLMRPRSPLIDAVAAHDKSKLRKVTERVRPEIQKVEERDNLLEQIRAKSFNLKPALVTRPSIQGPKTNLRVAAILEKANAIRQALAGSDEDDDVDSWSDS